MWLHVAMFALACTGRVRYVDLSIVPKPGGLPYAPGHSVVVRGGMIYDHSENQFTCRPANLCRLNCSWFA